jgi:hypothetical protein
MSLSLCSGRVTTAPLPGPVLSSSRQAASRPIIDPAAATVPAFRRKLRRVVS